MTSLKAPPGIGDIESVDPRFGRFFMPHAPLERLATGFRWAEGPAWFGDWNGLLFSDIPNNRIMRWQPDTGLSVYRSPSNFTNGNTRDRQGRLISCQHHSHAVVRTEYDGPQTVLADTFDGKRRNSPNDVVVKSDGSSWFTDPHYGIAMDYEGGMRDEELPCHVYRIDPQTGALQVVADDFGCPNGLCFSPDLSRLYIADTGRWEDPAPDRHIRVFDVSCDEPVVGCVLLPRRGRGRGRISLRRGRQYLDQRRRWRALRLAGGASAGPRPGAGSGRQCRVRRPPSRPAVHLRHDLALCDLAQSPGHAHPLMRPR